LAVSRAARPLASLPPVERARSLDALHRQRTPGIWRRVFRLRYLTGALHRLGAGTEPVEALPVPRPGPGLVSVTFVGHATTMVTTPRLRLLTDPLLETSFYGIRRAQEAGIAADDLADVDLILVTHAHRDHLSRPSLRRLPRAAVLVVPTGCASLVRRLGFVEVVELAPGQQHQQGDVEVTAVPVRHSARRGLGDYLRRGACGYVLRARSGAGAPGAAAHATIYVAGDTGYFSGFAEIGRRFQPDVALLPIAGYDPIELRDEHLSPLDACCAFEDLRARIFIPTSYGAFPLGYEPMEAPITWLRQLARERDWTRADGDQRVAILDAGQTIHLRMRA
jgi:L-ascorbate metabolism protein UlaG (beta-lactamase superfamily)